MKQYIQHDEWRILEEGFVPEYNKISESLFSIGNGHQGQRANFEEQYSGESLQGSYLAGIYYPDKTRVGWWKIGYPESFAKVLNAPNWIGLDFEFDGTALDLAKCKILSFKRELNMQEGYLERSFTAQIADGRTVEVKATRFCSIVDKEAGAIRYAIKPLDFNATLLIRSYIDGDVKNQDANWEEKFWQEVDTRARRRSAYVITQTKKTAFQVCTGMKFSIVHNGEELDIKSQRIEREKYAGCATEISVKAGDEIVVFKYAANVSSRDHLPAQLLERCKQVVKQAFNKGFDQMLAEQAEAWKAKWAEADVRIEGDVAAQQGIRFNIFQLYQTYTGEDERLNIGPKGFTGEKYGGSTYWDTEAYCLPFYLATAEPKVAANLLVYRYKHLGKAIENAAKLGFKHGAALYPMVTMDGSESHNEWEITFEEIHRNGAIAYAIYDYIRYTGHKNYLIDYGLEVLIAISRFWAQRVHVSEVKGMYVIHGVTGPNEYENNVNNNWYTNYIARWCMQYTLTALAYVKEQAPETYDALAERIHFDEKEETGLWETIVANFYLPEDPERGIFLQQEGFLDKELLTTDQLDPAERPINQHWSWDRILRSVFIKQADVLQGLYFFEDSFDKETIERNFDFYEPRTVHESSLSPCVHSILAAALGKEEKAYEMYLRTARLDLDDYNNDTEDGCHITSMAGAWMSIVKGFGGLRVYDDVLYFNPIIPKQWKSYTFSISFREQQLEIRVTQQEAELLNKSDRTVNCCVYGVTYELTANSLLKIARNH